jgi:hypothetical protein
MKIGLEYSGAAAVRHAKFSLNIPAPPTKLPAGGENHEHRNSDPVHVRSPGGLPDRRNPDEALKS